VNGVRDLSRRTARVGPRQERGAASVDVGEHAAPSGPTLARLQKWSSPEGAAPPKRMGFSSLSQRDCRIASGLHPTTLTEFESAAHEGQAHADECHHDGCRLGNCGDFGQAGGQVRTKRGNYGSQSI
jgi:hypothetical protein